MEVKLNAIIRHNNTFLSLFTWERWGNNLDLPMLKHGGGGGGGLFWKNLKCLYVMLWKTFSLLSVYEYLISNFFFHSTLLEMVKRREKSKRENLHLTIEIFEKR